MEREIAHRCGHTQHRYLGGFYPADREREAVRLARRQCDRCLQENRQALAADHARPHREALNGVVLPQLAGSPRQVAWAESIRSKQLAALRRLDPDAVDNVAAMRDARWWIDHRGDDLRTVIVAA